MSHPTTLTELRTRTRQAADCEVGAAASRIPNLELDLYINRWVRRTYDILVKANGEQHYATTATNLTTAGTAIYTWAVIGGGITAPLVVTGVALNDGAQDWAQLKPYEPHEWASLRARDASGGGGSIHEIKYNWVPTGIALRPAPNSSTWNMFLHYVPSPIELLIGTDTFDGINGWEDHAVYGAALECARKDNDTELVQTLTSQIADVRAHIKEYASRRDHANPPQIQDTRRDWAGNPRVRRFSEWNG